MSFPRLPHILSFIFFGCWIYVCIDTGFDPDGGGYMSLLLANLWWATSWVGDRILEIEFETSFTINNVTKKEDQ